MRDELIKDYRGRKDTAKPPLKKVAADHRREGVYDLTFPGAFVYPGISDYGEDNSSMPKKLLERIKATGTRVEVKRFKDPIELQTAIDLPKGVRFTTSSRVRMGIRIDLPCG